MQDTLRARINALARNQDTGEGRQISDLLKNSEMLSGWESQRLRTFCTSQCMEPRRDLDEYGLLLYRGNRALIELSYSMSLAEKAKESLETAAPPTPEAVKASVAKDLHKLRWGPTAVPIYNLLGLFMMIKPQLRMSYIDIARFFIEEAQVPVDGTDMSGTTALAHSFSTKPGFDFEYAQLLYDAGGDINHRNRYGNTVGQEIVQIYLFNDKVAVKKATDAMAWFLAHGGSVDIQDTDSVTVRMLVNNMKKTVPSMFQLVDKEDKRRAAKGIACCALCGREDRTLLFCSRCKKVMYCQPFGRLCQKLDWKKHKKMCKA